MLFHTITSSQFGSIDMDEQVCRKRSKCEKINDDRQQKAHMSFGQLNLNKLTLHVPNHMNRYGRPHYHIPI